MTTQSHTRLNSCAREVFECSAVKCHWPRVVWRTGSQAFELGIKSFRRDARQNIERDLFAVFAIDIEEDVDVRLFLQRAATGAHAVQ